MFCAVNERTNRTKQLLDANKTGSAAQSSVITKTRLQFEVLNSYHRRSVESLPIHFAFKITTNKISHNIHTKINRWRVPLFPSMEY